MSENEKDESPDKRRLSEMMRELALSGLATYFMTEDAVKGYVKEMKLPKELVGVLLDGAGKKKDEMLGLMVKEFGKILAKVDVTTEVSKFLESHQITVQAKVGFEPKDAKARAGSSKDLTNKES